MSLVYMTRWVLHNLIGEDEKERELGTSLTLQLTENLGFGDQKEWVSIFTQFKGSTTMTGNASS